MLTPYVLTRHAVQGCDSGDVGIDRAVHWVRCKRTERRAPWLASSGGCWGHLCACWIPFVRRLLSVARRAATPAALCRGVSQERQLCSTGLCFQRCQKADSGRRDAAITSEGVWRVFAKPSVRRSELHSRYVVGIRRGVSAETVSGGVNNGGVNNGVGLRWHSWSLTMLTMLTMLTPAHCNGA